MSSITKASQQQSTETTTKKKFGKNLNKLTKPPAPAASSPQKQTASSRNGLLLLSTKRATTGSNNTSSTGGILSSKPAQPSSKPLPVLGLQYESTTSTHDALLGAVVGASRAESQQQPDAWGVADKQQKNSNVDFSFSEDQQKKISESGDSGTSTLNVTEAPSDEPKNEAKRGMQRIDSTENLPSSNWDEYGGRNISPEKLDRALLVSNEDDSQGVYMSQRAKERSEQRRFEEESRLTSQKERANERLRDLEEKMGNSEGVVAEPPKQRTLFDPNRPFNTMVGASVDSSNKNIEDLKSSSADDAQIDDSNRQPMIQLSSYDDLDRGVRGSAGGPRMLYDPKSGSMVAVPSREDAANARGRKERGKKVKNPREKEPKIVEQDVSKVKKGKPRKDDSTAQPRVKVGVESTVSTNAVTKKVRGMKDQRLPRTCGVLYGKDNKGHYYSIDGSDGDLGYGAHSVPGGKTRNPDAFAKTMAEKNRSFSSEAHGSVGDEDGINTLLPEKAELQLQTGFQMDANGLDWLKPNEKLSLATGDDPLTLQATAKEWAPTHGVLNASAARNTNFPSSVASADESHDDIDDHVPLGLGFDPTLHMDSMMRSPPSEPMNDLDAMQFPSLSLEPAMQTAAQNTHNIFAFESGSTWGASHTGSHHDWGVPSSSGNAFTSNENGASGVSASFLSLSGSNTWGGVHGLSGASFNGRTLNDHSGSAPAGE